MEGQEGEDSWNNKEVSPPRAIPILLRPFVCGDGVGRTEGRSTGNSLAKCSVLGEAHGFGAAEVIRVVVKSLYFTHGKEPLSALKQPLTCTRPSVKGQQRFEQDAVSGEGVQRGGGGGALLFVTHWPD